MKLSPKVVLAAKVLVCLTALVGLVSVVAHGIAPGVPVPQIVALALGAIVAVAAVLLAALICSLQFRQFILRHGGIDTQWLWFRSDPPGLERLRGKDS